MKFNPETGKIILRVSLSLLFLWFGISQIYSPNNWIGFVPNFVIHIIPANSIVLLNGSFEILFGLMMLTGFYLRFSSFLMGIHLLVIAFAMGFSSIAVRDYAITLATISLVFFGPDKFCIDERLNKKKEEKREEPSKDNI